MLCLPLRVLLALTGALHIMVCQALTTLLFYAVIGPQHLLKHRNLYTFEQGFSAYIPGVFCVWCPTKKLKYGKPRLSESMSMYIIRHTPNLA